MLKNPNSPSPRTIFMSPENPECKQLQDCSLLIQAINFCCVLKTGKLAVHSPQQYSLGDIPNWEFVVQGFLHMFSKEILTRYPIVQHILYGSILSHSSAPVDEINELRKSIGLDVLNSTNKKPIK